MRILLAQNSLYYPAHGGGDKSNRLLIEALAARGHECRVVARISVFGAREQERYLESLAERGVTPSPCTDGHRRLRARGRRSPRGRQRQSARRFRRADGRALRRRSCWPPPTIPRNCCSKPPCAIRRRAWSTSRAPRSRCRSAPIAPFPARPRPSESAPATPWSGSANT